jgi:hypothetical protein
MPYILNLSVTIHGFTEPIDFLSQLTEIQS